MLSYNFLFEPNPLRGGSAPTQIHYPRGGGALRRYQNGHLTAPEKTRLAVGGHLQRHVGDLGRMERLGIQRSYTQLRFLFVMCPRDLRPSAHDGGPAPLRQQSQPVSPVVSQVTLSGSLAHSRQTSTRAVTNCPGTNESRCSLELELQTIVNYQYGC